MRPTGDHEVTSSIPAGSGNSLSWRLIMKYLYGHSFPSDDSRRAVVSFWPKNVHKYSLSGQKTNPAQEKVWLCKLTALDMTLMR